MTGLRTKFYLDKRNAKWLGVCAGISDYTGVDVTVIRLGFVLGTVLGSGMLLLAYWIIAWMTPDKPGRLYEKTREDKKFWQNVRSNPRRVARDVRSRFRELDRRLDHALAAGIAWEQILLDPGFGFGKDWRQNLELLRRLSELRVLERPLLAGTSRKRTIGRVLGLPVDERLEGTAATVALAIAGGADVVRVHDVRAMVRVARMSDAVVRGRLPETEG